VKDLASPKSPCEIHTKTALWKKRISYQLYNSNLYQ
jgi:hypothetical protein